MRALPARIYTLTGMLTHGLLDLVRDHQPSFSIILVGNQIADNATAACNEIFEAK
jgi:hypothetical protein